MFQVIIITNEYSVRAMFGTIDECLRYVEDRLENKADILPDEIIRIIIRPLDE